MERTNKINPELLAKPIVMLTCREFLELLDAYFVAKGVDKKKKEIVYLHGLKELAEYLGLSLPTVNRLRNAGVFDLATIQRGRILLFEMDKVVECLDSTPNKNHKKMVARLNR
ncbi:MAG: DUF3853 family protein [Bacteroidaceae bacterium]|nr:DUF3853 family protein [Bacteroidaceae bacterium]